MINSPRPFSVFWLFLRLFPRKPKEEPSPFPIENMPPNKYCSSHGGDAPPSLGLDSPRHQDARGAQPGIARQTTYASTPRFWQRLLFPPATNLPRYPFSSFPSRRQSTVRLSKSDGRFEALANVFSDAVPCGATCFSRGVLHAVTLSKTHYLTPFLYIVHQQEMPVSQPKVFYVCKIPATNYQWDG